MTDIKKEFDTAAQLIEDILKEDKRARNNDLWLILMVWQKKQNIKLFIPYEQLNEMISPETIRRCRQIIQNKKYMYLPTAPEILIKRRIREDKIREYFKDNHWLVDEWEKRKFRLK